MKDGRETLNVLQAARRVTVSPRTIRNWVHGGKVETCRTPGGQLRIFADTLWRSAPTPSPERTTP